LEHVSLDGYVAGPNGEMEWGKSKQAQVVKDAEALRRLKQAPGADMLLIGSASVARELARLGLIDEYRINVNPVILGGGTPLFPQVDTPLTLRLVASRTFGGGVVGLHLAAEHPPT
jgi:dihydrofolate reductase